MGLKKVLAIAIRQIPRAVGSAMPKCVMNYALWAEPECYTYYVHANRVHHATFVNIDTIASSHKTTIVNCLDWIGFVVDVRLRNVRCMP